MRHNYVVEGLNFRLRPVQNEDAAFIVSLRTDPSRAKFLHSTSSRIEDQIHWLESYYLRENDFYFIIEEVKTTSSHGTIGVYNVDPINKIGEWGRWIIKQGSLAALESVWLVYKFAFEDLRLSSVFSRTILENAKVVSFHDSCGIKRSGYIKECFDFGETKYDAIEHRITAEEWEDVKQRLLRLINRLAKIENGHL